MSTETLAEQICRFCAPRADGRKRGRRAQSDQPFMTVTCTLAEWGGTYASAVGRPLQQRPGDDLCVVRRHCARTAAVAGRGPGPGCRHGLPDRVSARDFTGAIGLPGA